MTIQLKAIVLYNREGEARWLPFKTGAVNIITGQSRRGKSALIDIVDYCTGRSTYSVFEGVNRGIVAWYAVVLTDGTKDIFIAKPEPEIGNASLSKAFFATGKHDAPVPFEELKINSNDDSVSEYLSRAVGFEQNITTIAPTSTKNVFEASIKHSKFMLFQEQGEIANKRILFHRQAEEFIGQGIRDAMPVILGAVPNGHLSIVEQIRFIKRELRLVEKHLAENAAIGSEGLGTETQLLQEAFELGLVPTASYSPNTPQEIRSLLKDALKWSPRETHVPTEDRMEIIRSEIMDKREALENSLSKIQDAETYLRHFLNYNDEGKKQSARLEVLDLVGATDSKHICPLCQSTVDQVSTTVSNAKAAFEDLQKRLRGVTADKPAIEGHIAELRQSADSLRSNIISLEGRLSALVEEREQSLMLRDRNLVAARTVGKIALYIEKVPEGVGHDQLVKQKSALQNKLAQLENLIDFESIRQKMESILNVIGSRMSSIAKTLDHEHKQYPFRLDIQNLTVAVDTPNQVIPMARMGSAENYLGCHLATMLSLHEYFIKARRPVPGFLMLDQPSQVYFPMELNYVDIRSDIERRKIRDPDVQAVRRMFDLLFRFCEDLSSEFQIIITEHANLPDAKYQDALVEEPWIGDKGLIPSHWLRN